MEYNVYISGIFHQESSQKSFSINFMRNRCTYTTPSGISLPLCGSKMIPLLYTINNANLIETCVYQIVQVALYNSYINDLPR